MSLAHPTTKHSPCTKYYTVFGVEHGYRCSADDGPPAINIDEDSQGDLYLNTRNETVWVRREAGWIRAFEGLNKEGMPRQVHPVHRTKVVLWEGAWMNAESFVAYRALNGEGVVASGSSSTAAPPTPDHPMEVVPSVPVAFTPLPLSVSTPVLGNTSVPVPQTSTHRPLLPPPAPRNEANAWLLSARALWKDGQARLAGDQVVKGVLILDALIESPSAIISTVSAERGTTSPCSILGPAERNGVAPSDLLAIVDLIACGSHGNISNSFTNLEEHPHEVTAADVLALQVGFLRGEYVPASQRLLSAFDIPATASGHLRCEYGSKPFVPGVDSRISQPTITWTFPGAITYPHMDGIFGLHVIHLMGTKMWIFAPPTKRNFQIMSN